MPSLEAEPARLEEFCRRWCVRELALFGSALRPDFGPRGDVDLLVTFNGRAAWSLLDLVRLERGFGELCGRKVALVDRRSIERSRNWLRRQEILKTAVRFHAA